jgi:uncharacterized protein DUF5990
VERELTFRIVLQAPPSGVDFGLQKGGGANYETVQKQRSSGKDVKFEFSARIRPITKGAAPDFGGPFVQGPTGRRFVYVDIGTYAGQADTTWSRRLKIPLTGITWATIDTASSDTARTVVETRIPGTGRDGGPNCATVKPFEGWKVVR